jgi:hypothetical protein
MRLRKTMMVAVAASSIAIAPVPRTMAMSIVPLPPQAPMAFGLGDITGVLEQFMPMLDSFLKDYMGGFFGDNFGLFQAVFDNVFGQLLSGGSFSIGNALGSAVGPAAEQIAGATGINQGLVKQGLGGAVSGNGNQVLNAGLGILGQYLKPGDPTATDGGTIGNGIPTTTNPNGTESGNGTGGLPSGGSGSGGTGSNGSGTSGSDGSSSGGSGSSGSGSGNLSCAYMSSCVGSLPSVYPQIFADAKGDLGIPDPNYVRGKIYDAAEAGLLPDNFVSNPSTGAFFVANEVDRQLTRASAGAYLSKEGQAAVKKTNEATKQLLEAKQKIVQSGVKAKSSQEVLKSLLAATSIGTELQGAQLGVQVQAQNDNQWLKINTANVSAAADQERRIRDSELSSQTYSTLYQTMTVYTPY